MTDRLVTTSLTDCSVIHETKLSSIGNTVKYSYHTCSRAERNHFIGEDFVIVDACLERTRNAGMLKLNFVCLFQPKPVLSQTSPYLLKVCEDLTQK